MKIKLRKIFASIILVGSFQGCGTGIDPLVLFDDSIPALGPIVSGTTIGGNMITSNFSSSHPYWTFAAGSFGVSNFTSPQRGIVTGLDSNSITILHSGRISTRISGITSINIRVGDTVSEGQGLAQFIGGTVIDFYVYLDGNPVCPLSFLNSNFRAGMINFSPCQ